MTSPPRRTRCSSTPPSTATSRSPSSVTSRSWASPSARAACAWSRSRASRSCRPPARRRSRTAWSSTPRPSACTSAQRAVVEFLLINHPLDCPVCDKGGECPLQDITYGWGPGTSRFIEPKRHFQKPLELSPLVAIDRERCILCYRCVRFSQEIAEDYQLILLERGAHSFVGTFDGHPYVAPFSGNIVELCPVGALTSSAYRFRARPWDIEGAGSICTLCPAQCNVELTVRDERVMRVLARDHDEVDDGWLCDKGRYAYQHVHVDERITEPLVREGEVLMPASWEKALAAAGSALAKAGGRAAALAAGETTNEEAFLLQRLFREGLGSGHLASRPGGELPLDVDARARRPRAAGERPGPRVRPHGRAARVRPGRRRPDPRPAHPQGRAPPRRARGRRQRPADRARPARRRRPAHRAERRRRPARRARRRAHRRRRRPRRRRQRRRLERRRRQRLRRGADRGGRGHRDRLRRAAARGPAAARSRRARCSTSPRGSASPAARAPACSRSRPAPTAAACARPASPAATGRATRRSPSRPAAPTRSPRASPTATSTRSTCCTPTRCARIPTARCGSRRWAPPRT